MLPGARPLRPCLRLLAGMRRLAAGAHTVPSDSLALAFWEAATACATWSYSKVPKEMPSSEGSVVSRMSWGRPGVVSTSLIAVGSGAWKMSTCTSGQVDALAMSAEGKGCRCRTLGAYQGL